MAELVLTLRHDLYAFKILRKGGASTSSSPSTRKRDEHKRGGSSAIERSPPGC